MAVEFEVNGNTVFCTTGGKTFDASSRTVIFIHGSGMDHTAWSMQSRWFAWHSWSVLVPDLPAHGKSGGSPLSTVETLAHWLTQLMDVAEVEKAMVIGHSLGSIVALQTAADFPERVEGLALLGTADEMPVHPDLLKAAQRNDPLAYDLITSWGHSRGSHFGKNPQPGLSMVGGARQLLRRNRDHVLFHDLQACNDWKEGLSTAHKVKCPSVVLLADQDLMTPLPRGKAIAKALDNCHAVVISHCGHMMMQEQPEQVLNALIGFQV